MSTEALWNQRTLLDAASGGPYTPFEVETLKGILILGDQTRYQLYYDISDSGHIARIRNGNGLAGGSDGLLESDFTFTNGYKVCQAVTDGSTIYAIRNVPLGDTVLGTLATSTDFYALGTIDVSGNWLSDVYVLPVRGEPIGFAYKSTNDRYYVLLNKIIYEMDFARGWFLARVTLNNAKDWDGLDFLDIVSMPDPGPDPDPDPPPSGDVDPSSVWVYDRKLDYWRSFDIDDSFNETVASRFDLPGFRDNMFARQSVGYNPATQLMSYLVASNDGAATDDLKLNQANRSCERVLESAAFDASANGDPEIADVFPGTDETTYLVKDGSTDPTATHEIAILSDGRGSAGSSAGGWEQLKTVLLNYSSVEYPITVYAASYNAADDTLYCVRSSQPFENFAPDGLVHHWAIDDTQTWLQTGSGAVQTDQVGAVNMNFTDGTTDPLLGDTQFQAGVSGSDRSLSNGNDNPKLESASAVSQSNDYAWLHFWFRPQSHSGMDEDEATIIKWGSIEVRYKQNTGGLTESIVVYWDRGGAGETSDSAVIGALSWYSVVVVSDLAAGEVKLHFTGTSVTDTTTTLTISPAHSSNSGVVTVWDTISEWGGTMEISQITYWDRATNITESEIDKFHIVHLWPSTQGANTSFVISTLDISGAIARPGAALTPIWSGENSGYIIPVIPVTGFNQQNDNYYFLHGDSISYLDQLNLTTGELARAVTFPSVSSGPRCVGVEYDLSFTCDDAWVAASLNQDLVHYWTFDETTTAYVDAIGSANFAVDGSDSSQTGRDGNALARTSAKSASSALDINFLTKTAFSINMWVKVNGALAITQDVVFFQWGTGVPQTQSGDGFTILARYSGGIMQMYGDATVPGGGQGWAAGTVVANTWHMLTLTYDEEADPAGGTTPDGSPASAQDWQVYFDGQYVTEISVDKSLWSTGERPLVLFPIVDGGGIAGFIDEVAIWDRRLWPSDIARMYSTPLFRS